MLVKKLVFFLLLVAIMAKQPVRSSGSPEEKKVAAAIQKQINEITKQQEDVDKLLDKIIAAIELSCSVIQIGDSACQAGWIKHGQSCYYMDDTPTERWNDTRQKCQNIGADLVIIRSSTENDFIFGMIKKQTTATHYGVWLGLKRNADSKFYWVDGSPLQGQYSAWNTGEPNDLEEKCVHMWGSTGHKPGKWNDVFCYLTFHAYGNRPPAVLCQKASL